MVLLKKAEEDIEVDEGYDAYISSVEKYHTLSADRFGDEPVNNIDEVLRQNRKLAVNNYKK